MTKHETSRQGIQQLETELRRRGATPTIQQSGRKTYLQATGPTGDRTVTLYVKTKQRGSWHTTIAEAASATPIPQAFWVFIELHGQTRYWIAPAHWVRRDIAQTHAAYLTRHGGHRPRNDESSHHAIEESRLDGWQDRWDILLIFGKRIDQPRNASPST